MDLKKSQGRDQENSSFFTSFARWTTPLLALLLYQACIQNNDRVELKVILGDPAALVIIPDTHDFGEVLQGNNSSAQTFTITNFGKQSTTGCVSATLGGTNPNEFHIDTDNCAGNQLAPGNFCTVIVSASSPTELGARSATLSMACDAGGGGTVTTQADGLTVTLTNTALSISPASYNFGNILQTAASFDSQTFFVTNNGSAAATGCSGPTLEGTDSGDFVISNNNCGATLSSNAVCSLTLTPAPTTTGVRVCNLSFPCTGAGSPGTSTTLSGITATVSNVLFNYQASFPDNATNGNKLNGARGVLVSPDGREVYVASDIDDSLVVFDRDLNSGQLVFRSNYSSIPGTTVGLSGAHSIAATPDGRFVYVSGSEDNSVTLFSRDLNTKVLTGSYPNAMQDAVATCRAGTTCDAMNGVTHLAISPDGRHMYISGTGESTLGVYGIDPFDGNLVPGVHIIDSTTPGNDGLSSVSYSLVSQDGLNVYTSGTAEDKLGVFTRDPATGGLTFLQVHQDGIGGVNGLNGVTGLALSPDGKFLYAAGTLDNDIAIFSRDVTTGGLSFINNGGALGDLSNVSSLILTKDGTLLYALTTLGGKGNFRTFTRDTTTGLLTQTTLDITDNDGTTQGIDGATQMFMSQDQKQVFIAGNTDDALVSLEFTLPATGTIGFADILTDGVGTSAGIAGAKSVALPPGSDHLYVAGSTDHSLEVYSRNTSTGALTFVETQTDGSGAVDGLNGINYVEVSPDGRHVYTTAAGDSALAVFSRDLSTGALTFVEQQVHSGTPNQSLTGANAVRISPDGQTVYAISGPTNALNVFSRDLTTGGLTFVELHQDAVSGVDGMAGANDLVIAPDGGSLYVTGFSDNAVSIFLRDRSTGTLTFAGTETNQPPPGVPRFMAGPHGLDISPDGTFLYVTAQTDNSVTAFSRNPTTGLLSHLNSDVVDGSNGANGLAGSTFVHVHPFGNILTAMGTGDNGFVLIQRDQETGTLSLSSVNLDGVNGISGVGGGDFIKFTPDGTQLIGVGTASSTIGIFDVH